MSVFWIIALCSTILSMFLIIKFYHVDIDNHEELALTIFISVIIGLFWQFVFFIIGISLVLFILIVILKKLFKKVKKYNIRVKE